MKKIGENWDEEKKNQNNINSINDNIYNWINIFKKNKSLSYITRYCPECNTRMNIYRDDIEHIYECPKDGYEMYERHYGGEDHYNDGRCRICDERYIDHRI